ncbi:hypothetical protein PLESTB_000377400 [Pleodorina starrii]|uniref:Uncharacterized protein n=1 Tax=Pleodorina starrii TaxID=330485 RepID=A0A9W6BE47_9CHLO|nr:hypothetical protein PLESTB_000377400 [Pleodorina starrii]
MKSSQCWRSLRTQLSLITSRWRGLGSCSSTVQARNIHSVYRPDRVLTSAYWDVLATLPSMVPPGPLGLLGLGAGTIPRIIAAHYPCRRKGDEEQDRNDQFVVHGWELDPGVIMASRLYLGMDELERNGHLVAHTGDALSPSASVPGGFSGIIVDLFAGGQLLPQLTKVSTWECIRDRLAEVGSGSGSGAGSGLVPRVIANLGQSPPAVPGMRWQAEAYTTLRAYEAMEKAFGGEVSLLSVESNTLALSGPLPGPSQWPDALPRGLAHLQVEAGSWARDVYPLQTAAVNLSLW